MRKPGLIGDVCITLSEAHTLETVKNWVEEPESFPETTVDQHRMIPWSSREVSYSHETNQITIHHPAGDTHFDASCDESITKFVRKLKSIASFSTAHKDQMELPVPLPRPTAEQLANATKLAQVGSAGGIPSYKRPKPRYNPPTASQLRSKQIIDGILGTLLKQGLT